MRKPQFALVTLFVCSLGVAVHPVTGARSEEKQLPVVFEEDFEDGAGAWKPFDATAWKLEKANGSQVYSQFKKETDYKPPHRSPFLISLLQDVVVTDFDLQVRVKSTHPDYGHRDACIVFGFQDPAHFYYVHLGKQADDHANQIFVVDDAPRTKISLKSTAGTAWDDEWHTVRIRRDVGSGTVEIYFDDLEKPVMVAKDDRFAYGQIGLGSFDDTTQWDDLQLRGNLRK
jgi:hypothetical protein